MANYILRSTYFRPSLDHHNTNIPQTNSTYLTWMRDPKTTFIGSVFEKNLFNYSVTNSRLLFKTTTRNLTLASPPVTNTTSTSLRRATPLYIAKVTLSGDSENQWDQIKTLFDNNLTADSLFVYNNIAYVCKQYRSGTTNADLIVTPDDKKLVNIINDPDKLFRHINKPGSDSSYSSSDLIMTKITKSNESFLLQNNYQQIWLDAGSYLFEQLYMTDITTSTNTDGETVVSATLNRIQKNVTVDSSYTIPQIVDMRD